MAPLFTDEGHAAFFSTEDKSATAISENGPLSPASREDEESLPMKQKVGPSVSFTPGASVLVYSGISIDDYSPEDRIQCWYQFDELRQIRTEVKDTVALMNQNLPMNIISHDSADSNDAGVEMKTYTTHGLEGKTKEGKRQRKENRIASLAAVLDEQNLQDMDGVCDPVAIASAYIEYSYPSQVAAFQRASLFQEEVAAIYLSMEDLTSEEDEEDTTFTDTSSSIVIEAPVESTYSDSNEFQPTSEEEEQDEIFYECNVSSFSEESDAEPNPTADTSNSIGENKNIESLEDEAGVTSGPSTKRDRFAYLLPGSASNSTTSVMGNFLVAQI